MDISNKHIIITGAGSGLGAATALYFAKRGATVSLFDINQKGLNDTETIITSQGFKASAYVCDVTNTQSIIDAITTCEKENGAIFGLVNCAGVAPGARIVGREGPMDMDLFKKTIAINLFGSFDVMRLVAEKMMQNTPDENTDERGVIINTASVAAFEGQIGQAAYSASKGAIAALTLPAAREFATFGIRVMTIAPGLMETPMLSGMPDDVYESLIATTLFPHRLGKPDEYAQLAHSIFDNPLLNGETIRLDGAIRLSPK